MIASHFVLISSALVFIYKGGRTTRIYEDENNPAKVLESFLVLLVNNHSCVCPDSRVEKCSKKIKETRDLKTNQAFLFR